MPDPTRRAAVQALYASELALSLEKLNFQVRPRAGCCMSIEAFYLH